MLSDSVSSTNPTSTEVTGTQLAQTGRAGQNTLVTAQVAAITDGDSFDVDIEAMAGGSGRWDAIGKFTDNDDTATSVLPISLNCRYRFKHIDGAACRVVLTG